MGEWGGGGGGGGGGGAIAPPHPTSLQINIDTHKKKKGDQSLIQETDNLMRFMGKRYV